MESNRAKQILATLTAQVQVPLLILFASFLLFSFYCYCSSNFCNSNSCCSLLLYSFTFCYRLKDWERATTITIAIVGRATTIWRAVELNRLQLPLLIFFAPLPLSFYSLFIVIALPTIAIAIVVPLYCP